MRKTSFPIHIFQDILLTLKKCGVQTARHGHWERMEAAVSHRQGPRRGSGAERGHGLLLGVPDFLPCLSRFTPVAPLQKCLRTYCLSPDESTVHRTGSSSHSGLCQRCKIQCRCLSLNASKYSRPFSRCWGDY